MWWILVAAGAVGFLVGLRFRVWAVAAICFLSAIGLVVFGIIAELAPLSILLITIGVLTTLQFAYAGGALVALTRARRIVADTPAHLKVGTYFGFALALAAG